MRKITKNLKNYICNKTSNTNKLENKLIQAASKGANSVTLFVLNEQSWWHGWDSLMGLEEIVEHINENLRYTGMYITLSSRNDPTYGDYSWIYKKVTYIELHVRKSDT